MRFLLVTILFISSLSHASDEQTEQALKLQLKACSEAGLAGMKLSKNQAPVKVVPQLIEKLKTFPAPFAMYSQSVATYPKSVSFRSAGTDCSLMYLSMVQDLAEAIAKSVAEQNLKTNASKEILENFLKYTRLPQQIGWSSLVVNKFLREDVISLFSLQFKERLVLIKTHVKEQFQDYLPQKSLPVEEKWLLSMKLGTLLAKELEKAIEDELKK